jgi:hypothetical protein
MICQQATLSGEAQRPKVADAVIEALCHHFFRTALKMGEPGVYSFFFVSPANPATRKEAKTYPTI